MYIVTYSDLRSNDVRPAKEGADAKTHATYESAEAAARSLTAVHKRTCWVCQIVAKVELADPPVTVTRL